jgi:hypothetical protein
VIQKESSKVVPNPIPTPLAKPKGYTGNRLLYGSCVRLVCVRHARRVRNDDFGYTIVERLNAVEGNSPLVQRGHIGGFLGRLGKA